MQHAGVSHTKQRVPIRSINSIESPNHKVHDAENEAKQSEHMHILSSDHGRFRTSNTNMKGE